MKAIHFVLCASLGACAAQPKPAASEPATQAQPSVAAASELAPRPYTAEQIRAATSVGRSYEFKLEMPNKPTVILGMTFVEVTDQQATVESLTRDETGKPLGPPERGGSTWAELVTHASFPRDQTVISAETVEVPAGKFACTLYTIVDGPNRKRAYFATNLPGPPVLTIVEQDGQLVQTLTLLKHVAGQ